MRGILLKKKKKKIIHLLYEFLEYLFARRKKWEELWKGKVI